MDTDFVGYENKSEIYAEKKEGKWFVVFQLTQRRAKDLDDWAEKNITFRSNDVNLEKAIEDTQRTLTMYLSRINGNLFSERASEIAESIFDGSMEKM